MDWLSSCVHAAPLVCLLAGLALCDESSDPLDTERFASASDYFKGENRTPAKAQLQTIVRRDKQRVRLDALHTALSCEC